MHVVNRAYLAGSHAAAAKYAAAINEGQRLDHASDRRGGPGPDELKPMLVDGEKVRRHIDVDFTMGGNPSRYAYVPKGELWVEKNLSPADRMSTFVHENVEHRLMKDEGMSYNDAHGAANRVDGPLRAALGK